MKPIALAAIVALTGGTAIAGPQHDAIIAGYAARAASALDAERGRALFLASHPGGKPDTPSCTTCHTADPAATGQTRAGKPIEPMAVSHSPERFTDPEKLEKWFGRNCGSVLGRECTAMEKGDILLWLNSL